MKYVHYVRGEIPLHTVNHLLEGVPKYSGQLSFGSLKTFICAVRQGTFYWVNSYTEFTQLAKKLFSVLSNPIERNKHLKKYMLYGKAVDRLVNRVRTKDLSKLTNIQFIALYSDLHEAYAKFGALSWEIDPFDYVSERKFKRILETGMKKTLSSYKKRLFSEEYGKLTSPAHSTFATEEKKILIRIRNTMKQRGITKLTLKISNHPSIQPLLTTLEKDFWWTDIGWEGGTPKRISDFIDAVNAITPEDIEKTSLSNDSIVKTRNEVIKRYKLPKQCSELITLLDYYAPLHDYRKEISNKITYAYQRIVAEVSRRKEVEIPIIEYMWKNEVLDLLQNNIISLKTIQERRKCLYIRTHPRFVEYRGKKAEKAINSLLSKQSQDLENFSGTCASVGKVTARVKVCMKRDDALKKLEKGDILVTGMTTPEFVPAMRLASGIITNEGGITCHAAIIARELGVPCITGTNVATSALHDNDIVELDANHGVVTLIKKK